MEKLINEVFSIIYKYLKTAYSLIFPNKAIKILLEKIEPNGISTFYVSAPSFFAISWFVSLVLIRTVGDSKINNFDKFIQNISNGLKSITFERFATNFIPSILCIFIILKLITNVLFKKRSVTILFEKLVLYYTGFIPLYVLIIPVFVLSYNFLSKSQPSRMPIFISSFLFCIHVTIIVLTVIKLIKLKDNSIGNRIYVSIVLLPIFAVISLVGSWINIEAMSSPISNENPKLLAYFDSDKAISVINYEYNVNGDSIRYFTKLLLENNSESSIFVPKINAFSITFRQMIRPQNHIFTRGILYFDVHSDSLAFQNFDLLRPRQIKSYLLQSSSDTSTFNEIKNIHFKKEDDFISMNCTPVTSITTSNGQIDYFVYSGWYELQKAN